MSAEKCKIQCAEMEHLSYCVEGMKRDMVLKSTLRWVITVASGIFIFIGGIGWQSVVKARDERTENRANIKVFNVKQDMVLEALREIKASQEKARIELGTYKNELKQEREKFQQKVIDGIKELRKNVNK